MFGLGKNTSEETDPSGTAPAKSENLANESTDRTEENPHGAPPESPPKNAARDEETSIWTRPLFTFGKKDSEEAPEENREEDTSETNIWTRPLFTFGKQAADESASPEATSELADEETGFFSRLKAGLQRTRSGFTEGLADLLLGKKEIDDELLEELEMLLLQADVGIEATQSIIGDLTARMERYQLDDAEALFQALEDNMITMLEPVNRPLEIPVSDQPFVIMMVGINGAGKTTTVGKLARKFQNEGRSVVLAAGDTFRAAAVEQLQVWGERNNVPVIAQTGKADSAAVLFDALNAATARGVDIVLADTAGRLHTQDNLMEELKKVSRVLGKVDPQAPHETLLVLDASIGQNALNQAKEFHQAVRVTGIAVTKLDGTAKGGIVFALAQQLGLPIRYIGVGEKIEDLRPFDSLAFVHALLDREAPEA